MPGYPDIASDPLQAISRRGGGPFGRKPAANDVECNRLQLPPVAIHGPRTLSAAGGMIRLEGDLTLRQASMQRPVGALGVLGRSLCHPGQSRQLLLSLHGAWDECIGRPSGYGTLLEPFRMPPRCRQHCGLTSDGHCPRPRRWDPAAVHGGQAHTVTACLVLPRRRVVPRLQPGRVSRNAMATGDLHGVPLCHSEGLSAQPPSRHPLIAAH